MSSYTTVSLDFVPARPLEPNDFVDFKRCTYGGCGLPKDSTDDIISNERIILNETFNHDAQKGFRLLKLVQDAKLVKESPEPLAIGEFSSEDMYLHYNTNIYSYRERLFIVSENTEHYWMHSSTHYKIWDVDMKGDTFCYDDKDVEHGNMKAILDKFIDKPEEGVIYAKPIQKKKGRI